MNLILGCTKNKRSISGQAKDVYEGRVFQLGIKYAEKVGWNPMVLSAKYGIISVNTIIESYDQKLRGPYLGDWPSEEGVWLGSKIYFGKAPSHIKRWLPIGVTVAPFNWGYGEQTKWLQSLLR